MKVRMARIKHPHQYLPILCTNSTKVDAELTFGITKILLKLLSKRTNRNSNLIQLVNNNLLSA